jgi:hypothetical protein
MATKKTKAPKKSSPKKKAAPKKAAPKKAAPKKAAPKKAAAKKPVARQDRAGHLAPKYAKDLRRMSKASAEPKDPRAFVGKRGRSMDPLAEELAEEFVETVTSGEDEGNEIRDKFTDEEVGGPFINSSARREFGYGTDKSNPKGSKREPFPTT